MASFMDYEAVESEDEDVSDEEERARVQAAKKSKRNKAKALSSDEEEDEDEDEEKAREEMKDFIASDDEDEESDSDMIGKKRRRRSRSRSRSENEDIDEEDMELLQENLGFKIKKTRKRIRMDSDEDEDNDQPRDPDELPDIDAGEHASRSGDEEADDDDFIVDEDGRPIKRDRKKKKSHIFSDSALQLADDIFTVARDYDLDEDDVDEDEEYESDVDEDEDGERRERHRARRKRPHKTIFDEFEPDELERRHYTDKDNEIRNTDIPERMQLRLPPVLPVAEGSDELVKEAEWIFKHYFCKPTLSRQDGYTRDECHDWSRKGGATLEKIRNALDFIRQGNEPPFIAFYRKEYVQPELKINDLWRIFYADGFWCKLQTQKLNLGGLLSKMQAFQCDRLMQNPDEPLPDGVRILSSEDMDKIESVETFEELKDREQHFKLYYGSDIEAMQEWHRKKKREERETKKLLKKDKKQYKLIVNEEGQEIQVTDEEAEVDDDDEEGDEDGSQVVMKQASRSDPYLFSVKNGLAAMAGRFGLTSEQFGENLQEGYQRHDVNQESSDPADVAAEYINSKFTSTDTVLSAAKFILAKQIARNPVVMKVTRDAFYDRATVTVRPTKQGFKVIDESHDCFTMKYLKEKPVRDLIGDQWLRLVQAHEQKLLEIDLAPDLQALGRNHSFLQEAQDLFKHDAYSKSAQEWNTLRKSVVELAFQKFVYPELRKELWNKLNKEARDGVLRACRRQLFDWLKVARFTVHFEEEDEDEWGTSNGCRIMGIMYENDQETAAFATCITVDGELDSFRKLPNLLKRKNAYNEKERLGKMDDLSTLKNFIRACKPHCIVIGVADRTALDIKMDVEDVVKELVEGDAQFPKLQVYLMDDNLAKVFANSTRAEQDFRDHPNVLRQAISLARRMQDPLLEFSQLTTADNEILCLRYNPMQDQLSQEELLEGLTIEFVNRTCEVGVDINKCVAFQHMSNVVQFVGGLGPRKGSALLKTLRQMQSSQRLENRQQLVTLCHMGPKVLINCAGFIKIDTTRLGDSEVYVEVLDGSRIHNEAYEWARKMAVDALEYDEEEGNPANALEEILQEPEKLAELDLDAFAEELERQGFGKKHITLQDIRSELHCMYKDLRELFTAPDKEDVFNMVTKESPKTFYPGKLIEAKVTGFVHKAPQNDELDNAAPQRKGEENLWQCPFCGRNDFPELTEVWNHFDAGVCPGKAVGVRIRLDNGATGFIAIKNLSDSPVINPAERVKPGQVIQCRIMKINPDKLSVDCICKSSALRDADNDWKLPKDDYYDHEAETRDTESHAAKKISQQRQTYTKRVIVHPSFFNISFKDAERALENSEQGEMVFRPSSKGHDRLSVTWKVASSIYQHIDIKEDGKIDLFSLGKSLWIGNEEFEDLDEIAARYIAPMAAHARDILSYKYYRDANGGSREKAAELILQDRQSQPNKIHYFFSASKEVPGTFLLTYLPREKPLHERVHLTPEGFIFRKQTFDTLSSLLKWFKEHFRDPIPGSTPATPGRLTNRTPYLTGTPRGAITPGAMSMAAGTPYGATPATTYGGNINTPYTPSGQTPMLTPGPSIATPRIHPSGASTPRIGVGGGGGGRVAMLPPTRPMSGLTPMHPPLPASLQDKNVGRMGRPYPSPSSYHQQQHQGYSRSSGVAGLSRPGSGGGKEPDRGWKAADDAWARGARRTPRMEAATGSAAEGRTPRGYTGSATPNLEEGGFSKGSSSGTGRRSAGVIGDATPLYDEH